MKVNGIKYEFSQKELYWTIVGADDGVTFTSSIPEKLDGYPVLEIGEKAFYASKSLTGIVLPRSINKIGREAFSHCENLQYVSFEKKAPTNLNIGEMAFYGCTSLKRFQASERFAIIQPQAFAHCESLHYIDCKMKTIAFHSFTDCQYLDAIIFADKAKLSTRCMENCNIGYLSFEGDAIIPNIEAFLRLFSDSKIFATDEFSYWDLAYEGLHIAPRQTTE